VAGIDLHPWFVSVLETTEELDYTEALGWFGLRFKPETTSNATAGWLGLETKVDSGRLLVTQVRRETPGWRDGFNVDDEILAIDGYRVRPEQWAMRLASYRPGDRVAILVARRERLRTLDVTCAAEPPQRWQLEVDPAANTVQQERFRAWLAPTIPGAL
jgi:predicted metalloprotease with PDZ domain